MRTEAELCATAAPLFYRLRVAQLRGAVARSSAPDHIRARRRTARHQRAMPRGGGGCLSKAGPSSATGSWVVTTPSPASLTPPGPPTTRSSPVDILCAATEGTGAFQATQRAAIKSCSAGFGSYLDAHLKQLPCTDTITFKELLPMPRPFSAPAGPAPRSSRRRARWAATRAALTMANQAAAAVSWLACGSPTGAQARANISRLFRFASFRRSAGGSGRFCCPCTATRPPGFAKSPGREGDRYVSATSFLFGRIRPVRSRGETVDDFPVGRFRCRSPSLAPYSWVESDRSGR